MKSGVFSFFRLREEKALQAVVLRWKSLRIDWTRRNKTQLDCCFQQGRGRVYSTTDSQIAISIEWSTKKDSRTMNCVKQNRVSISLWYNPLVTYSSPSLSSNFIYIKPDMARVICIYLHLTERILAFVAKLNTRFCFQTFLTTLQNENQNKCQAIMQNVAENSQTAIKNRKILKTDIIVESELLLCTVLE